MSTSQRSPPPQNMSICIFFSVNYPKVQSCCCQRSSTNAIPSEIQPHPNFPANALLSPSNLITHFDSTYFEWLCEHFVCILVLYQVYSLAIPHAPNNSWWACINHRVSPCVISKAAQVTAGTLF
jgi:hypothetical protein